MKGLEDNIDISSTSSKDSATDISSNSSNQENILGCFNFSPLSFKNFIPKDTFIEFLKKKTYLSKMKK